MRCPARQAYCMLPPHMLAATMHRASRVMPGPLAVEPPPADPPFLPSTALASFVLHLDKHMADIIAAWGNRTYALLFAIVFAETGLVLTPFLPGDSLLFACGTFAALGSLNFAYLIGVFFVAAVLGDAVNYAIGNWLGRAAMAFKRFQSWVHLCWVGPYGTTRPFCVCMLS